MREDIDGNFSKLSAMWTGKEDLNVANVNRSTWPNVLVFGYIDLAVLITTFNWKLSFEKILQEKL